MIALLFFFLYQNYNANVYKQPDLKCIKVVNDKILVENYY